MSTWSSTSACSSPAHPLTSPPSGQDIRGVVELAHGAGAIVKVILETCLLTFEEKLRAADLALAAGADFLKTSTGFSTGGATVDDIALLREEAGTRAGVKASGGIRSLADAAAMLNAGASRIGASASVASSRALRAGCRRTSNQQLLSLRASPPAIETEAHCRPERTPLTIPSPGSIIGSSMPPRTSLARPQSSPSASRQNTPSRATTGP